MVDSTADRGADARPHEARVQFEREKFLELFRFSMNAYEIELYRSESLDRKASGFVAILTFLIGGVAVLGKWLADNVVPPDGCLEASLLVVCVALFLSLVVAWFRTLDVFRLRELKLLPVDKKMQQFFTPHSALTVYVKLSERLGEVVEYNVGVIDKKATALSKGHAAIRLSCVLFVVLAALYLARVFVADC